MTLIVTHISKLGIIQACDANITYSDRNTRIVTDIIEHDKVFPIPHLNSALTVAGSFSVGNVRMDKWMPTFIQNQSATNSLTLELFATNLCNTLTTKMSKEEKEQPTLIHIAGYSTHTNLPPRPEMWFVRNAWGISSNNGSYTDIRNQFQVSEEVWGKNHEIVPSELFAQGGSHIYANGFPEGRAIYWSFLATHNNLLNSIWANPALNFRPPQTLDEMKSFVELDIRYISELFKLRHENARAIGGTPKTHLIPNPI